MSGITVGKQIKLSKTQENVERIYKENVKMVWEKQRKIQKTCKKNCKTRSIGTISPQRTGTIVQKIKQQQI